MRVGAHHLHLVLALSSLVWQTPCLAKQQSSDEAVCTAPFSQHRPRIVVDDRGGAIVAWQDFRSNFRAENYAQRLLASGEVDRKWPMNGRSLANGVDSQRDAILVSDNAGGAIVAWEVIGGSERDHIIYVHHLMSYGVLDPTWPVGGVALSAPPGVQVRPAMVEDGSGGAIVAWVDFRNGAADIYAQRVLDSGVADPAWPSGGVALCTASGFQDICSISSDGAGGAIVGWLDRRSDAGDLYAQHILASGQVDPDWPVDGRAVCTAQELQANMVLVSDGAGGVIAAWVDRRDSGPGDIYAQHVFASGEVNPAWPSDGVAVCTAPGDQTSPAIVSDKFGGAFVAWGDLRASNGDIYAHHLLLEGLDPDWPSNGLVVCGTGTISSYAITADGAGGALLAWSDRRGSIFDIYAHHLLPWGVDPAWPANGLAFSTGPGYQIEVAIAADRKGRAFVTWRDSRSGTDDIYASRLNQPRPVWPPGPGAPLGFGLRLRQLGRAAQVVIDIELPEAQPVSITVFDVTGRAVRTFAEGRYLPAGAHAFSWNGADDAGSLLKRGVYLVRVRGQGRSITRKHVVLH